MKKSPLAVLLTLGLLHAPLSAFAATAPLELVGPISDYKIYVTEQLDELASHTQPVSYTHLTLPTNREV